MSNPSVLLTPDPDRSHRELGPLALQIEDAGFSGIYTPEVYNDGLTGSYALALATRRVRLGTWVTNIFFRVPSLCATAAAMIQDVSEGRFVLGLGISHRPLLECLGIDQGANPAKSLRDYTATLRRAWSGDLKILGARFPAPTTPIPIYFGSMLLESARQAGEIGDGIMLLCCTIERYQLARNAALESARAHHGEKAFDVTLGVPTFIDKDLEAAYEAARHSTALYLSMPNYNRMFAASGFEAEAAAALVAVKENDHAALHKAATDRLLDAVSLIGPPSRCIARLHELRAAGVVSPIIVPGPNAGDVRAWVPKVIATFSRLNQ
jgi:alkanesulfonate monooxygenase SsuD/methylene tetrahydromethanopterin reductase-like flavin-dependent oxidoreductase (luciferase family)